jgi:hypothetical protein
MTVSLTGSVIFFAVVLLLILPAVGHSIRMRNERKRLKEVFVNPDPSGAALRAGGKQLLISLSFAELFSARCLDVRANEKPGQPVREYRLRHDVDVSLLAPMERILAGILREYRSYPEMLIEAERRLGDSGSWQSEGSASPLTNVRGNSPEDAVDLYKEILRDALAYTPPESGC